MRFASVTLAEGETRAIRIVLNGAAVSLAAVTIRGSSVCRIRQDSGQLVARVWEEARKALTASRLSTSSGRLYFHWEVFDSVSDRTGRITLFGSSSLSAGFSDQPFVSISPDTLAQFGYVRNESSGEKTYWAPDADVLLSEPFAELHCFRVEPSSREHPAWVGVSFHPARERSGLVDVEGTLWLDRESAELRLLDYRYTGIPQELVDAGVGGTVEFLRLATGNWLLSRWVIRLARAAMQVDFPSLNPRGDRGPARRQLVVNAIMRTGGTVTSVERVGQLIFSTGTSSALSVSDSSGRPPPTYAAMCGDSKTDDSKALIHGTVVDTTGLPVSGAEVEVSWRVPRMRGRSGEPIIWLDGHLSFTSQDGGWWFLCGVPRGAALTVRGTLGDRGPELEVKIPWERSVAAVDVVLLPKKAP